MEETSVCDECGSVVADRWRPEHTRFHQGIAAVLAAPKPEPVPGNVEALRELHRLAEYVHDNFRDDAAEGGGTIVDVAIRLLTKELIRRDVAKMAGQTERLLGELRNQCIGQDRCAGDNCPAHRDAP